ncbi:MAG: protein kinase [Gemmatimonadota bacterium]
MSSKNDGLKAALSGRYQIERELGEGGMATVYLAEDLKHDRKVAVKVLKPELAAVVGAERFLAEIKTTANLQHPHILPLFDSGHADSFLYYVMPYIEGESLRERLDREGQLPVDEAVGIATKVAGALQAAHDHDVIHRDIKPANILLANGEPLVADFGIALAAGTAGGSRLTETGLAIGSPGYMSPEQASGDTGVDHRTDVYSLGCVVFEMMGGRPPFAGPTPQAVLARILTEPPPSLQEIRPSVPEGVERVIERALAKAPDDRFDTIQGFAEALAEANTAQAIAEGARRNRRSRRRRTGTVAAAVGLLAAIGWWMTTWIAPPTIERLAVLPPINLMNDPDQEFLVQGVHNALISELQQTGIAVIARTSVMQYKNTDKSAREIARELGVDALVEPSVLRAGDSVDVQVQLVDGDTQEYLGDPIVVRADLRNVVNLYRDLTRAIAGEIQSVLTPQAEARLASARPVDPEAYEAYLRGQSRYEMLTLPDAQAAVRYFQAAIDIDPDYAPAHAGLALGWIAQVQMGFLAPREGGPLALAAVERALELDSALVEVQYAAAVVRTWYEWDWEGAEQAFQKAIAINPNYGHARAFYGHFLMIMGRPAEAIEQMELAVKLDPFNELFQALYGVVFLFAQRLDEAIERFELALGTLPDSPLALNGLAAAYNDKGMYEEAVTQLNRLYTAIGDEEMKTAVAAGYEDGGYQEALIRGAEILVARAETSYVAPVDIATLFLEAGDYERALDWLETGYDERDPNMPYQNVERLWDSVRDDPRYREIMRRMDFPNSR